MIQFGILSILSDLCSLIYFVVVAVDMTVEAIATVVVVAAEDTEEVVAAKVVATTTAMAEAMVVDR